MIAALVFDAAIKSAILGLVALAATRRVGLTDARRAHRLWLLTLGSLLLFPVIGWWSAPATLIVPSAPLRASVPAAPSGFAFWAAALYFAVAFVLLARVVAGVARVRAVLRRAIPIEPETDVTTATLVRACTEAGAQLVETAAVGVPATAGFFRPRVLLPSGWRELDAEAVGAAVRHELAHVRRSDYLVTLLIDVLCGIWWFHPVTWVGRRQVRWLTELACDHDAAQADEDAYAGALLRVARAGGPGPWFVLTATTALGRRIELLLAGRRQPALSLAAAVIAVVLLGASFFTMRFSPSPQRNPPAAVNHSHRHAHVHGG